MEGSSSADVDELSMGSSPWVVLPIVDISSLWHARGIGRWSPENALGSW